jgi:predicted molibdopterin-dependent oxidoreductase YjgC
VLTALLVVNDSGGFATEAIPAGVKLDLTSVSTVVVLGSHQGPLVDAAAVALPLAMWGEVDGTITNKKGMVQRLRAAREAAGDSLPGWEILAEHAQRLGLNVEHDSPKKVFLEAKATHGFMKDADWGRPILPVQLRFANTRG